MRNLFITSSYFNRDFKKKKIVKFEPVLMCIGPVQNHNTFFFFANSDDD